MQFHYTNFINFPKKYLIITYFSFSLFFSGNSLPFTFNSQCQSFTKT